MHILYIYQGRYESHAFLWDSLTLESLLVYDINDRQSKYYRHSFLFIHNNIYLGNYANQVLQGSNHMPSNLVPQNTAAGFIYKEIDIANDQIDISGHKLHLNLSGFLAILLKKIYFDACYINNYRPVDEIIYLTDKYNFAISNRKTAMIANLNIKAASVPFTSFNDGNNEPGPSAAPAYVIQVFWKEENALIFLSPNHPDFNNSPLVFEHNGFKKQFFTVFCKKANIPIPLSAVDLLKWEESVNQILLEINGHKQAGTFLADIEVAGELYFLRFGIAEIQQIVYQAFEDLIILIRTLLPAGKTSFSKITITAEFFNNHFLEQAIVSLVSKYEISPELFFYSIDNFKNIISPKGFAHLLVTENNTAGIKGNNLLNNSFYMSYYNPAKDKLDLDCIFHKNMELPCSEVRIVKTRFLYQNRVYFEIFEKPNGQSENYFASIEAVVNDQEMQETAVVLLLTFKIGIDSVLNCLISDQQNGKKINANIIYAENGSYTELRQFEIVKNLKIMNNYMDKRRETQLGIF